MFVFPGVGAWAQPRKIYIQNNLPKFEMLKCPKISNCSFFSHKFSIFACFPWGRHLSAAPKCSHKTIVRGKMRKCPNTSNFSFFLFPKFSIFACFPWGRHLSGYFRIKTIFQSLKVQMSKHIKFQFLSPEFSIFACFPWGSAPGPTEIFT